MKYITDEDKTYFKGLKKYMLIIAILYILSLTVGIAYSYYNMKPFIPQASNNYSYNESDAYTIALFNNTYEKNNADLKKFDGSTKIGSMMNIMTVNLYISTFSLSGIAFGIVPVFSIIFNGFVIGELLYPISLRLGLLNTLLLTLPHGIIEDIAIIVCMAIGIRLGHKMILIFKHMFLNKNLYTTFKSSLQFIWSEIQEDLHDSTMFYIKFAVPMIIIAAVIEGYITYAIAHAVTGI